MPSPLRLAAAVLLFAAALCAAQVPVEQGRTFNTPSLTELARLDTTIRLDIRYATPRNFMHRTMYTRAQAFMQRPAAEALARVSSALRSRGYGVLVFDAYRPWRVTKQFWDATPKAKKKFVANPKKGSVHNRGCAVDLSLYDRATGTEIAMTSPYDDFTERAAALYGGGTDDQRKMRDELRKAMEAEGFTVNPDEWWHFDYKDWKSYPILDVPFEDLK